MAKGQRITQALICVIFAVSSLLTAWPFPRIGTVATTGDDPRVFRRQRSQSYFRAAESTVRGLSVKEAVISRVVYCSRRTAHSSQCSMGIAPTRRVIAASLEKMPTTSAV